MYFKNLLCPTLLIIAFIALNLPSTANSEVSKRFYYQGDGKIKIRNPSNGISGTYQFRDASGKYLEAGLKALHRALKAPWNIKHERLNLRFIEMLDYLQDKYNNGTLNVRSGYRSYQYNQKLRRQGKMAATSSMHIEGAAADLRISGTPSAQVFKEIRDLACCGIGYYGSAHFHIDTGPVRWWNQFTSKTKSKEPQLNALIIIQTEFDYYQAHEEIKLQFMRVTDYPIRVQADVKILSKNKKKKSKITQIKTVPGLKPGLKLGLKKEKNCIEFTRRSQARQIKIELPKGIKRGDYQLQIQFCEHPEYPKMPQTISSRIFSISK